MQTVSAGLVTANMTCRRRRWGTGCEDK